jgi:mannosyltransferase
VEQGWLGLALAAIVLTVLSVYRLGSLSFWNDEVASVKIAREPLAELVAVFDRSRLLVDTLSMSAYHVLLHVWLAIGATEQWVRLLSVVFGVATTVPVFLTARRLAGPWAGTFAALIIATNAYVISWDQQARGYSLAMLVAGALTIVLLRATERQTARDWLLYAALAAFGVYVHFWVGLVVAAQLGWIVVARRWPARGAAWLAFPLFLLAMVPVGLNTVENPDALAWLPPISVPAVNTALQTALGGTTLLVALLAVLAFAAVDRYRDDPRVWLLAATVVLPVMLGIVISIEKPIWHPRYLVVIVPAVSALAGIGLASLRGPRVRAALAAALALVIVSSLPHAYARRTADWHAATGWMHGSTKADDLMVIVGDDSRAPTYYLRQLAHPPTQTSLDWVLTLRPRQHVWLATYAASPAQRAALDATFKRFYAVVTERNFSGLDVALLKPLEAAARP